MMHANERGVSNVASVEMISVFFGVLMLVSVAISYHDDHKGGLVTTGHVVRLQQEICSGSIRGPFITCGRPIYEFTAKDGYKYEARGHATFRSRDDVPLGKITKVRYSPKNPDNNPDVEDKSPGLLLSAAIIGCLLLFVPILSRLREDFENELHRHQVEEGIV